MCTAVNGNDNTAIEVRAVTHRQFSKTWFICFTTKRILLKLLELDYQC